MKNTDYFKEIEDAYTPLLAIEEASRCLLCHDAPCSSACPIGTNPAKFIRSMRFRNFKGAVETIRENNILGGVCARVCPTSKYCEGACSRTGIDKPIEISKLQRYLTDYESALGMLVLEKVEATKDKVAIIGSGPSGLACATQLAKLGYKVTVFEGREELGGWLTYGIPQNRLPKQIVNNEIQYIKNLGVEFKTSCTVGYDISIDDLKKQGFKAFLVAVGMQNSKLPSIPGINLKGVLKGIEFLAEAKSNNGNIEIGNNVIVIGGGDVAIDCASTAKLLGSKDVQIVYRRSMDKMPADRKELAYAESLNIPIFTGFKPAEIIGQDGYATRFKATGMFDDRTMELPADTIIFAIGQEAKGIETTFNISLNEKGIINTTNYMTNVDGIFASGDIALGDKTVVYALKEGKEAAEAIDTYLSKQAKKEGAK